MHKPVLLNEVLHHLQPQNGEIYVDMTFGAGGYSRAILESCDCRVFSVDRDVNAVGLAGNFKREFGERFDFLPGNFSQIEEMLAAHGVAEIDGIVFDLGVSSMQFDDKERGFSFDSDAPLDMRMSGVESGISAFDVVNEMAEGELASIIKEFGEERQAKRIARKIVEGRKSKQITSCRELADIVRSCFGGGYFKIDPATRTFQAIRIFVNRELEEVSLALEAAKNLLKKGGRLIVVSFHSLEDVIVKNFLKEQAGIAKTFSRYEPQIESEIAASFKIVNKSAIKPSEGEVAENYRSRSSKMRVAVKL